MKSVQVTVSGSDLRVLLDLLEFYDDPNYKVTLAETEALARIAQNFQDGLAAEIDPFKDRGEWKAVSPSGKDAQWQRGSRRICYARKSGRFVISDHNVWMDGSFETFEEAVAAHERDATH